MHPDLDIRVWDVQYKFYGQLNLVYSLSEDEIEIDYDGHTKEPRKVNSDEVILEKFTGRKDEKEVKLYEGDIVIDSLNRIMVIEYCQTHMRWKVRFICFSHSPQLERPFILADLFKWFGRTTISLEKVGSKLKYPEMMKPETWHTDISSTEIEKKNDVCPSCGMPRSYNTKDGFEKCVHCGDDCPF